ncbi:hypothetical protein BST12_29855, partial [Mycobacterium angelicum]
RDTNPRFDCAPVALSVYTRRGNRESTAKATHSKRAWAWAFRGEGRRGAIPIPDSTVHLWL